MVRIPKRFTLDCPDCSWPLVPRRNMETNEVFLGCSQWPACKHTKPLPEHIRLEMMGAPRLPGM